jgi:hypothetical protein
MTKRFGHVWLSLGLFDGGWQASVREAAFTYSRHVCPGLCMGNMATSNSTWCLSVVTTLGALINHVI